jgi:FkbM family methyltransferase
MKKITIVEKEKWKEFILVEAQYYLPDDCFGGICVDAGSNIGDFEIRNLKRFDKYVCFDVFEENIVESINNTKDLGLDIEFNHLAVWSESDEYIDVLAYEPASKDLQHFGNSGNVGCIESVGSQGEGWKKENKIGVVKTISIESIIEKYGTINLLKIDVEGSEYKFLLGKDLSKINFIVGEIHFDGEIKQSLIDWICRTHSYQNGYFRLK